MKATIVIPDELYRRVYEKTALLGCAVQDLEEDRNRLERIATL